MIAIIGAMDEEVLEIKNIMFDKKESSINGIEFCTGKISNTEVVLLKSGIGKVNAAICTTLLLSNFQVDNVINIGTAGGLLKEMNPLDVVVSTKVAHHDWLVERFGWPTGFDQEKTCYSACEKLVAIFNSILIEDTSYNVFVGPIASGDLFVSELGDIEKILSLFPEAMCAEMEACGVAQVCKHFNKPFIVIRSLSDVALNNDNNIEFDTYLSKASKNSAIWCKKFISKLEQNI